MTNHKHTATSIATFIKHAAAFIKHAATHIRHAAASGLPVVELLLALLHTSGLHAATGVMEISNLHVMSIVQDSVGYVWMGTARGINRIDPYRKPRFYFHSASPSSLADDYVAMLHVASNGDIVAFNRAGINCLNRATGKFSLLPLHGHANDFSCAANGPDGTLWIGSRHKGYLLRADTRRPALTPVGKGVVTSPVISICPDSRGLLWLTLGGGKGVVVYDPSANRAVRHYPRIERVLPSPYPNMLYAKSGRLLTLISSDTGKGVRAIATLQHDITHIGTTDAGMLYFLDTNLDIHVYNASRNAFDKRSVTGLADANNITSLLVDHFHNIWIGTFDKGYILVPPKNSSKYIGNEALCSHFANTFVTAMTSDGGRRYWVSTRHGGLIEYDPRADATCQVLKVKSEGEETDLSGVLFSKRTGRLWVSAWDGVYCLDTSHGHARLATVYHDISRARYITEDRDGRIWVACLGNGALWTKPKGGTRFARAFAKSLSADANITYITQLRSGRHLFAYYGKGVFADNGKDGITPYMKPATTPDRQFLEQVIYIYEDCRGRVWLGSYGKGLMMHDPRTNATRIFTMEHGLPSNDVLSITEDPSRHTLWISTSYGLSRLQGSSFTNYFTTNTLYGNQYHERGVYAGKEYLYFMGNHGITSFNPRDIENMKCDIPIAIGSVTTSRQVYDQPSGESPLKLGHDENSFTVEFAGFDFASAGNLQYSYRLEGYDNKWSNPSTDHTIRFKELPPGTYVLQVRVADNTGSWSKHEARLTIVVPTSPWLTWWAVAIYIAVGTYLCVMLIRMYVKLRVGREKVKMSEQILSHEQEQNRQKTAFYENISHELKTPLGLIYGPYCELAHNQHFSQKEREWMSLIGANIERLQKLVEQIMYLSHHDMRRRQTSFTPHDIVAVVGQTVRQFSLLYAAKHIDVAYEPSAARFVTAMNKDCVDSIMQNVLSNAFKYTPQGGKVTVRLMPCGADAAARRLHRDVGAYEEYVIIEVADNGIGIMPGDEEHVFDRFFRSKNAGGISGTGIGLFYTRCLVEEHHGMIKAERNADGGFTAVICLPAQSLPNAQPGIEAPHDAAADNGGAGIDTDRNDNDATGSPATDKPTMLIVDDEPEVQNFLNSLLGSHYSIHSVFNGDEGWAHTLSLVPDIVITDIMMPGINGNELCARIKGDDRTCHIPVVMLSAKDSLDERIEGVGHGADAYIGKPFNPDYMKSVISGLLANRRRMQNAAATTTATPPAAPSGSGPRQEQARMHANDKQLLDKLNKMIENEMCNSDLSLDELTKALNFSTSTFYRKVKSLTGLSPNEYVRLYRLQTAARMIEQGHLSISEVAFKTGFGTLSYFSSMFKKQFGMTPSEYKSQKTPPAAGKQ